MHGRLKVRTTEEQKLIKQKIQQERLVAYRHGMKIILATRHEQPYNKESFGICTSILERNPDVHTLWNYRKEVLGQEIENLKIKINELSSTFASESRELDGFNEKLVNSVVNSLKHCLLLDSLPQSFTMLEDKKDEEQGGLLTKLYEDVKKLVENVSKVMLKELDMTEICLLVNPKSYGAWHHRFWILQHHPKPNWEEELQLVEKYLRFDDRNFHTWDYRRSILKILGYKLDAELQFSTDRINTNFSNYSSWHYRSALRELNAETLVEELRLVQNAVFTDPYDSSTWFYLRWVLSNKAVTETHRETLLNDFEQLLELEPNCKWIYMAKCWITGSLSLSNKAEIRKNVEVYKKLVELDPMRKGIYEDYIKLGEETEQ